MSTRSSGLSAGELCNIAHVELDEFCALLGEAVGLEPHWFRPSELLIDHPDLDEVLLARILFTVEGWNPSFRVPDQLSIDDLTVADLHHFARVMSPEHGDVAPK